MVLSELLSLFNLLDAQTFGMHELMKVIMVYKYENFVLVTF